MIQEILDFKTWVLSCLRDGPETLVGHTNMHLFNFFVDSFGWPMMQYKVSLINSIWSPIEGPLIQLWKVNADGFPKLPTRVCSIVPYCPIWGHDVVRLVDREKFINVGLFKYVEFWKQGSEQSVACVMKISPYVDY